MKTLTLKIPENIEIQLITLARERGISKSQIVREALMEYFSQNKIKSTGSFTELAHDLAGCVEGPSDLAINKNYLKEYGE